jgi:hypothetical protein
MRRRKQKPKPINNFFFKNKKKKQVWINCVKTLPDGRLLKREFVDSLRLPRDSEEELLLPANVSRPGSIV